jgi:hypothetical protein
MIDNDKTVCIEMELNKTSLSLNGTILHAIAVMIDDICFFVFDDIYFKSNKFVAHFNWYVKFQIIHRMLNLNQFGVSSKCAFGIPAIEQKEHLIFEKKNDLPYIVKEIRYMRQSDVDVYAVRNTPSYIPIYGNFIIQAEFEPDIYTVYAKNGKLLLKKIGIARVSSTETIELLNSIFKKNQKICQEESDDEDIFENINADKYIDTQKKVLMKCEYNTAFKKWTPISILSDGQCEADDIRLFQNAKPNYYKQSFSHKRNKITINNL